MKYKILIVFVVLMLFLVSGCIETAETNELVETGEEAGETTTGEEPQREVAEEEEEKVMSEELSNLLAKAGEKVNSMSYLYYGPPDDEIGYAFSVLGNKMKVVLPEQVRVGEGMLYDAVYLNTEEGTAFGYCEAPACADKEIAFSVEYEDYIRETPFDKLSLVGYGEIKGGETLENRNTKVVEFEGENVSGRMWIDTYSGLPLKVEETREGGTIETEYRSLGVNSVMEEDVKR